MLILLSPAKTLDWETPIPTKKFSLPQFLPQSAELIEILKSTSLTDIQKLMNLSENLAQLNLTRYNSWHLPFNYQNSRPAIYSFMGDVYLGLQAYELSEKQIEIAQNRLRILSGLYGILKPLDLIQPYRLEMGTSLKNSKGKNLYEFWGDKLTLTLNQEMEQTGSQYLVNLASEEYFSAIKSEKLSKPVISPKFLDAKNGKYKTISFFAKKARGMMASWLIQNEITKVDDFEKFNLSGYRYNKKLSTNSSPTFIREELQ